MSSTTAVNSYYNDYTGAYAVNAIVAAVIIIFTGVRFYVQRALLRGKLGLDNWLLLAGVVRIDHASSLACTNQNHTGCNDNILYMRRPRMGQACSHGIFKW